jgi:hypothetical protein
MTVKQSHFEQFTTGGGNRNDTKCQHGERGGGIKSAEKVSRIIGMGPYPSYLPYHFLF